MHVSPEPPGKKSGGQYCVYQSLLMMSDKHNHIDYVGPKIEDESIKKYYNCIYELEQSRNILEIIYTLLCFQYNKRFCAWKKLSNKIDFDEYDYVYIDFTKQNYVVKSIKQRNDNIPIYVRAHNVECDYSKNDFIAKKTIKKYIASIMAKKHEAYILRNVNEIFVLTSNDRNRFQSVYKVSRNKMKIIPICLETPAQNDHFFKDIPSFLITGSLWYGVNLQGIMWIIEEVLPLIRCSYKLTIAGAKPSDELKKICMEKNIELIDTPISMQEYLEKCDAVIVPVFSGAGMKVKIAEALANARPVITTSFGAIGYALADGINSFICETKEEFAQCIEKYARLSDEDKEKMMISARDLFEKKYSIQQGKELFEQYIE